MELFRREAVTHQRRRLEGEVLLATPLPTTVVSGILVTVVFAATFFLIITRYERKEVVPGWIVPNSGLIRVAARQSGVVEELKIAEGAQIRAGDPIAEVRLSSDVAGGDSGAALLDSISSEARANQAAEIASRDKLISSQKEMLDRKSVLGEQLAEAKSRDEVLQQKEKISEQHVARSEALMREGYMTATAMDEVRLAALSAAEDASQIRATELDLQRQLSDLDDEVAEIPNELAALNAQNAQTKAALSQRKVSTEAQSILLATAPISGRIAAIPVERGQSVTAGTTLAVITPKDSPLSAELYAPSRAVGFIAPGQQVRLMYQAFPYQIFGTGHGVVTSVSRTVLAPDEVQIPGVSIKEPVFRVRVALSTTSVSAYGRRSPLEPGMLLSANVIADRRSLMEWLLDPIYAVSRRQ
jgi:membrane fusion protein